MFTNILLILKVIFPVKAFAVTNSVQKVIQKHGSLVIVDVIAEIMKYIFENILQISRVELFICAAVLWRRYLLECFTVIL